MKRTEISFLNGPTKTNREHKGEYFLKRPNFGHRVLYEDRIGIVIHDLNYMTDAVTIEYRIG